MKNYYSSLKDAGARMLTSQDTKPPLLYIKFEGLFKNE